MAATATIEEINVCRSCDGDLWKRGAHRRHHCSSRGCACPVCHPAPSMEVRDILTALKQVSFLLPLAS